MASARQLLQEATTPEDLIGKLLEAADMLEDNLEASPQHATASFAMASGLREAARASASCSTSPASRRPPSRPGPPTVGRHALTGSTQGQPVPPGSGWVVGWCGDGTGAPGVVLHRPCRVRMGATPSPSLTASTPAPRPAKRPPPWRQVGRATFERVDRVAGFRPAAHRIRVS